MSAKPRVAVYKFSSCDGCQLSLLNLEEALLTLVDRVEIAYFLEATRRTQPGPYDIALVEGSVSTPEEARRIHEVREQAGIVIALGTCACSGGVQALRNFAEADVWAAHVYPHPEYLDYLARAVPIADEIRVDYEIWGCPVNGDQVVQVLAALLMGKRPVLPDYTVCQECKRRGNVCVMVAEGKLCLGPVTRAGCGALCPAYGRGCYGCFGPWSQANTDAFLAAAARVASPDEVGRALRHITGSAPAFAAAADRVIAEQKGGAS